jgi:hypothetical protein
MNNAYLFLCLMLMTLLGFTIWRLIDTVVYLRDVIKIKDQHINLLTEHQEKQNMVMCEVFDLLRNDGSKPN